MLFELLDEEEEVVTIMVTGSRRWSSDVMVGVCIFIFFVFQYRSGILGTGSWVAGSFTYS